MIRYPPDVLGWFEELHSGAVAAVLGLPRCGKSTLVQAADAAGIFRRRVTFDPYARRDRLEASRGKQISPWPGTLVDVAELRARPELLDRDPLALVLQPDFRDVASVGRDFTFVARLLWSTGEIDLVAEEAGLYSRHAIDLVNQLATGGGHVGMRVIFVVQSFTRLHVDARRPISHIASFAQSVAEADELRKHTGKRCDFADRVRALRIGERRPVFWRQGDAATGGPLPPQTSVRVTRRRNSNG